MTITDAEFIQFSEYIRTHYGIHLTEQKKALLTGRLITVIQKKGLSSFGAYFNEIATDRTGAAIVELLDRVTTNHTFFYREKIHYEFFESHVLPEIKRREKAQKDLRLWSAGCSTGDEAYTLTMLLYEVLGKERTLWDTQILATDISEKVLNNARIGRYDLEQIKFLPKNWQHKYFEIIDNERVEVGKILKENVIFRRLNLMHEFPFKKKFHTIFCRNVMIYFNGETKRALVRKFWEALEEGGYLFIGHSETLEKGSTPFTYVQPAIYRKGVFK